MAANLDVAQVRYGRRKLDADAYEAQEKVKPLEGREGTRYGEKKGAVTPAAASDEKKTAGTPATPPATSSVLSIAKLETALKAKRDLLDSAIQAELRQEVPRKGALELFIEVEKSKGESARGDVLTTLEAALASREE